MSTSVSEFKSSFALQTSQPSASSVLLGAASEGTSDSNEARYWYQSFGLGSRRKYGTSLRRFSHVRRVILNPDPSVKNTKAAAQQQQNVSSMIQQVVFGPPAFSRSTPMAVVAGPRVSLYGTAPSSLLNRTLARHSLGPPKRDDDDDSNDDDDDDDEPEHNRIEPDRNVPTGGVPALSCSFRSDGRLLAVGTAVGQVRICDTTSRVTLRTFVTSSGLPVRTVHWFRNGQHVLSGGDDGLLRVWSLSGMAASGGNSNSNSNASVAPLVTLSGHGDAIRTAVLWQQPTAAATTSTTTKSTTPSTGKSSSWTQLAMSGSYDHTIRIWNVEHIGDDTSSSTPEERCLSVLNHGAPVEALLLMPSSSTTSSTLPPVWLLSAGGTHIKVWNPMSGTCVWTVTNSQHRKTITCLLPMMRRSYDDDKDHQDLTTLAASSMDSSNWRIVTGGLDGLCRIHTWSSQTGRVEYMHGFPIQQGPITSMAVNETHDRLAIGTSTGCVLVRQKGPSITQHKRTREPRAGTYAFFTRGQNMSISVEQAALQQDYVATAEGKKRKLRSFDVKLRQFRYADALDEALETRQPQAVMAVLEELGKRRGLVAALSHRDEESLEPILSFCVRYITRPRFSMLLIGVAHQLMDIYASVSGQSETVDELFNKLREQVKQECRAQKSLLRLVGQLDGFLTARELER